jgi:hypothetical protein
MNIDNTIIIVAKRTSNISFKTREILCNLWIIINIQSITMLNNLLT